ncbi:MAG: type IV secretion system protein, partial [Alphaproteobacteria bacterium]
MKHVFIAFLFILAASESAWAVDANGCHSCEFFDELYLTADSFIEKVYRVIGPALNGIMKAGLIAYILVFGVQAMLGLRRIEQAVQLISVFLLTGVAIVMTSDFAVYRDWVHDPLQKTALGLAQIVLDVAAADNFAGMPSSDAYRSEYGRLIHMVEVMVWGVIKFCATLIANDLNPARMIAGLLLLLPYLFVFCIFSAFLVEAMFKFIAIGLAAPLLVAGIPYPFTRAFAKSGFRILLGAVMTVFFAAAAMGFTMSTVHSRVAEMENTYGFGESGRLRDIATATCDEDQEMGVGGGAINDGELLPESERCKIAEARADAAEDTAGTFSIFTDQFFVMFTIGFVSILLHLQAKSLASNLSGANDGPGPAAAVIMGAKAALAGGVMATQKTAFGRGGVGGFVAGVGQMVPGGSGFAKGGLVGGAASSAQGILNAFSGNGNPAQGEGWSSAAKAAGGAAKVAT